MILSSKELLPADSYTHVSEAWHTTSWLDHCISTFDAHDCIEEAEILYGMTTVDHIPISMFTNIKGLPELVCNDSHKPSETLDWARLTDVDLQYYKLLTDVHLRNIELPVGAIMCGNINCKNVSHNNDLCAIYMEANDAFRRWVLAGKPRHGPVCEHKVRANARFKYAVRFIKRNEQTMRANSMVKKLQINNVYEFWKEVKVVNNSKMPLPSSIDGITET